MRRHALPAVVLLALALALAGAALAPTPDRLPAVALAAWPTFTHVGSRGIEIPDVLSHAESDHETAVAAAEFETSLVEIKASIQQLDSRLGALEHPRDVVLHSDPGDLA